MNSPMMESKSLLAVSEKSSRLLPSSPKPVSPRPTLGQPFEMMESSCDSLEADLNAIPSYSIPSSSSSMFLLLQ